ncbi:hypothetical protein [Treponema primitia]|uniref:hypothetical protein n=1 Tax=Treponema primitia TaxID=88058 RepID=UPI000255587D|nr:hypothetical protein [Treponema primitia]
MSNENTLEKTFTDRQKLEAAYALNLCTVSVSQIVDYNDIYILEQEYDAILNNLNIQNIIHDEVLLSVLKQILDTITFFKIQEGDKKFIEKEYQAKLKNAIWSAVPNLSVIIAGGNPITAAIGIASQIGIGYMSYRKTKSEAGLAEERAKWELQRAAIEQFSALQRELFACAWRLSDKYNFDDRYRLTEKQIRQYNTILLDPDPMRRYERLDTQKQIFQAFPPFWYYKGNAAKEVAKKYEQREDISAAYKAKALEDYQKFDTIYVELMREDVIAASCALEHIVLLDKAKDGEEIRKLLDRAIRLAGDNFDVLQIAVLNYISLGEQKNAKAILRRLVNEDYNISLNGILLSRIYCKWEKNKVQYDILLDRIGKNNVIPWIEDDAEADKQYIESREKDLMSGFNRFVDYFTLKYKTKFNELVAYDKTANLKKRLEWSQNTDITQYLVDTLNEMFTEMQQFDLFSIQKRQNNARWSDYFKEQADLVSVKIIDFNKIKVKAMGMIVEISSKTSFNILNLKGNENEINQKKLESAIEVLIESSEFIKVISDFPANIKEEFRKSLTVESVTNLQDNMSIILEQWYSENGYPMSSDDSILAELHDKTDFYFAYPKEA